jgi:hypothetical protein
VSGTPLIEDAGMSKKRAGEDATELRKSFKRAATAVTPPAVAIGVDVTWFGGSGKKSEKGSRMECIAYALKWKEGWGKPEFQRVTLTGFKEKAKPAEPNSDPNGQDLLAGLKEVLKRHEGIRNVVVALDAPLMAIEYGLGDRCKKPKKDDVKHRQCDKAWSKMASLAPTAWKGNLGIQPGAPVPSRIAAIVKELTSNGFILYTKPDCPLSDRVLIECFPNEVIWSAGVLECYAKCSFASMVAYKRMGKAKTVLPLSILKDVCFHTFQPCLQVAGLKAEWASDFWKWLTTERDGIVCDSEGVTGKCFDDAIDSMLSLIAAAAFVDGNSHVHQGEKPLDGHIIGPGFPKDELPDAHSMASH